MTAFTALAESLFNLGDGIGQEISSDTKAEKSPCGSRFFPLERKPLPGDENLCRKIVCLRRGEKKFYPAALR